jgi:hypothetical protein
MKISVMKKCAIMIVEVTQILLNLESVTPAMNSENEETEEESVKDERAVRSKLEDQDEWHWKKVYESYRLIKIPFSETMAPYSLLELHQRL